MVRVRKEVKIIILSLAVVFTLRFTVHLLFFRPYNEAELQRYLYGPFGDVLVDVSGNQAPEGLADYMNAIKGKSFYSRNKLISRGQLWYLFHRSNVEGPVSPDAGFDAADELALKVFLGSRLPQTFKAKIIWINKAFRLRRGLSKDELLLCDVLLNFRRYESSGVKENFPQLVPAQ